MYKNFLLTMATVCGSLTVSFSQATLTAANFNPVTGDAFINHICDTTGITPGLSGAGITWDFSTLTTTAIDTGTDVACSATAHCSLFPGSSYAIVSNATTIIPYYIENDTELVQDGYYESADTNAVFSEPIVQFKYPFTYNTSLASPYSGVLTIGSISAIETGTMTITCDGYGTLVLPGVTEDNVLRVHTSQLYADSADLFGTPIIENFVLETYAWYKVGYHSPLMSILTTTGAGSYPYKNKAVAFAPVQYYASATPAISSIGSSLQIFPNPVVNELNIQYTSAVGENVRISLSDLLGNEVALISNQFVQTTQSIKYSTANLPKGIYLLRLQSGSETMTRKVEIL